MILNVALVVFWAVNAMDIQDDGVIIHDENEEPHHMRKCLTEDMDSEEETEIINHDGGQRARRENPLGDFVYLEIEVVFHVIHNGNSHKAKESDIEKQIDVMNEAMSGRKDKNGRYAVDVNFTFILREINYHDEPNIIQNCRDEAYKKFIDMTISDVTLNVFTCPDDNYLGWTRLPWRSGEGDRVNYITIHPGTLPGGSFKPFNKGMTLVHESGHWFGLYHTFHFGCGLNGDFVEDTPMEAAQNYICNYNRDTCSGDEANDPVWNFMGYTDDDCVVAFTAGQRNRMHDNVVRNRPKLLLASRRWLPTTTSTQSTTTKTTTTTI
eukprot:m.101229 g.101229  ORF g.101229 m.101229 type:complete len:323 (+) comp13736_c2_seq2:352-1320(+)